MSKKKRPAPGDSGKKDQNQASIRIYPENEVALRRYMAEQEIKPDRTAVLNHALKLFLRGKYPDLYPAEQ